MAEESELVGGISVSLGATHEHLAGDIAAANAIVEEQWSNKVFTAKLRVESASGAGQIGPAAAPGAAQAGPIVVQARAIEETGAQTAQARSALAIPTQQTTPGMTEGERVVEGLGGVEDATSGVAKSVQELAELQGRGTEAPTPAVVSQQRVERVQAAAGEISPSTGTDVEAARTAALLSTHLENLNANIIGLGDRLGGAPARGGGRPAPGPAVSFGSGGSVRGGQLENLPTALQDQIRSALGEAEQGAVKTTAPVVATARPQQTQAIEQIGSNLAAIVNEIVGRLSALSAGLGAFTERLALAGATPVGAAPRSQAVAVERAGALRSATVPTAREAIASVELQAQTVSVEPLTTPAAQAATSSIGVPVTASSMQMRDAEQAAAARARRETQNEARVAATAVQDRGIPDTSQEWLEERYTRPLAAQAVAREPQPAVTPYAGIVGPERAAAAASRSRQRDEVLATPNIARELERVDVSAGRAVDTVEIAARSVAMPDAQVEAQAASIEAPRAAVTAERPESVAVAAPTGGGGGRPPRRPTAVAAPPSGEEPEEEGGLTGMTRRAAFGMREEERAGARIQGVRSRTSRIAYNESEKQRRTELNATVKHYDSLATLAGRYFDSEANRLGGMEPSGEKAESQQRLQQLSYEAQRVQTESTQAAGNRGFVGRTRTPAQIATFREEEARRANAAASAPRTTPRPGLTAPVALAPRPVDEVERARRRALAEINDRERVGRGGAGGGVTDFRRSDEEIERRQQLRVVQGESQRLTAARTSRTFAAGLGGFSPLGTARQQLEANAGLTASNEKVAVSQRRLSDPAIIRSPRAYRQATEELTVALKERAMWTEKIEKLATGGTALRTLAAVTVAGAAFGLAMQGVSVVTDLATTTLGAFIDEQGGFASTSTRVTGAIAQQTAALHGNVDAALATVEAQAGLNKGAADYLNTQFRMTAQIKAGAIAQQQASELFRARAGGGETPEGLFGGFGGIGGSPLLAQQLGGGKGFSEIIQGDLSNLSRNQEEGNDLFAKIGQGLSYLTNPDFRQTIDNLSAQQGQPTPSQANPIGNALGLSLPIGGASALLGGLGDQIFRGGQAPPSQQQAEVERVAQAQDVNGPIQQYLKNLNENIKRGGGQGRVEFTADPEVRRLGMASAAAAGDLNGVTSASQGFVVTLNGAVASTEQYTAALAAAAAAASRPTPEVLMGQFAQTNPALINAAGRQQQFAANIQFPAQQALQNLANPLKPVGTGFAAANAEEQARVADTQKESQQLQDQLNTRYEQGRQIIQDTYRASIVKNFGEAAGQQFDSLLTKIKTTGQAIADIQASISNEQAAYQTAQYNYQLGIAKRTLSDIGGLTGKNFGAGQSYLGQLEKENLALSRQGQQLQFNLSQRSINFQRAVAGFTAPGLTPEERAARIEQANIEADIAQKQLDIGKNIFQNQVQIVDIQNLRQGADLVKQIALLEQGRAVTIDVQVKTEELERLIAIQQQQVAEAGTYIAQVESLVQAAFGQIQQLEVAAGSAVAGIANKVLEQFGLTLDGINNELEEFAASMSPPPDARDSNRPREPERRPPGAGGHAEGVLGRTSGATDITIGEAGAEEVAVLRNPRAYLGGGGGQNVSVVFTGEITVRSEDDLRKMEQTVESAIVRALGRGSSLQGLRIS